MISKQQNQDLTTSETSDVTPIESTSQQREISVVATRSARSYDIIDAAVVNWQCRSKFGATLRQDGTAAVKSTLSRQQDQRHCGKSAKAHKILREILYEILYKIL